MTSIPALIGKDTSTRDKIILIIASEPGMNTKKINAILKKQYSLNVTYQAVHKTLKQMLETGIISSDGKSYSINKDWLNNLRMFADKVDQSSSIKYPESKNTGEQADTRIIEVNSLKDVDYYWLEFEKRALKELVGLPEEQRILYLYLPHCWFALSYPQNEHEFMRDLKKIKGKVYYFCSGDTVVDRWVRDFYHQYPDSPYRIFLGVEAEPTSEKWISPFVMMDVIFPSEFMKVYDELYNKTSDMGNIKLGRFLDRVYQIKQPIHIIQNTNANVIENISKISSKRTCQLLNPEEKITLAEDILFVKNKFIEYWKEINELKPQTKNQVIDLGMGMPDPRIIKVPQLLKQKLHESIDNNDFTLYMRQEGDSDCIKEIVAYENNILKKQNYSINNILFTMGAINAFSLFIDTFVAKNEEILMFKPMYFSQVYLSNLKAKSHIINNGHFNVTFNSFKANINENTKVIALCQPNNPTGLYIPTEELAKIIEYAKNLNIYVVIDESCNVYVYDEEKAKLPANINESNVIRIKGFSKLHNLSGYRIGYLIANENIITILRQNVPAIYGNPSTMANRAIFTHFSILNNKTDELYHKTFEDNLKILKKNRDFAYDLIKKSGISDQIFMPEACYYMFFRLKSMVMNFVLFQDLLNKKNVNVLPGIIMGMPQNENWIRICFARDPKILEEGLKRIISYIKEF